jgi:hypothetical protein
MHPGSVMTLALVAVFSVFLFVLQSLLSKHLAETQPFSDIPIAAARAGTDAKFMSGRSPNMRTER